MYPHTVSHVALYSTHWAVWCSVPYLDKHGALVVFPGQLSCVQCPCEGRHDEQLWLVIQVSCQPCGPLRARPALLGQARIIAAQASSTLAG